MGVILIIIGLFLLSHSIGYLFPTYKDEPSEGAYFHFKGNKFIKDYSGIHFHTLNGGVLTILGFQDGSYGYDKCITICNISFIWGSGK